MIERGEPLLLGFAEAVPAGLSDLGSQACDQKAGAENRQHRRSPKTVCAGDKNETQQQDHRSPNTIAGTAEFNGQKWKQQEC